MIQYIVIFMLNAHGNVAGVLAQIAPAVSDCSEYAQAIEVNVGQLPDGMRAQIAPRCVPQSDIVHKLERLQILYQCAQAGSSLKLRCSGKQEYL